MYQNQGYGNQGYQQQGYGGGGYNRGGGGGGRNRQKDEEQVKKLFIGGLDPQTTEDDLKEHFGQYGEITDVVVLKDPNTKRSKGFGFITFEDVSCVDSVQSSRPHKIGTKTVDTKRAIPRDNEPGQNKSTTKMFVGGLPKTTTVDMMRETFEIYGDITDVAVVKDKQTGESRGFGFVTFKDHDSVDSCLVKNQNKIMVNNKMVDIKKALPQEDQSGGGGGRGGRQGGMGGQMGGGGYGGDAYGGGYKSQGNYGGYGSDSYGYQNDYSGYGGGNWNADFGQNYGQDYGGGAMRGGGYNQRGSGGGGPYRGGRGGRR